MYFNVLFLYWYKMENKKMPPFKANKIEKIKKIKCLEMFRAMG